MLMIVLSDNIFNIFNILSIFNVKCFTINMLYLYLKIDHRDEIFLLVATTLVLFKVISINCKFNLSAASWRSNVLPEPVSKMAFVWSSILLVLFDITIGTIWKQVVLLLFRSVKILIFTSSFLLCCKGDMAGLRICKRVWCLFAFVNLALVFWFTSFDHTCIW